VTNQKRSVKTTFMSETRVIGRNEPCPCGSGKKYKRCCGVGAAPKLSVPAQVNLPEGTGGAMPGGFDPSAVNPEVMMQFTQALQRLPKGQLQRLQAIMAKAMSGKDVTAEAKEFENSLPVDFQNLIHSFKDFMPQPGALPQTQTSTSEMTEEQARALVAKAAQEGVISQEKAENLLKEDENKIEESHLPLTNQQPGKLGKFWKNLGGGKKGL
jgi:hypothetical protein